MIGVVVPLLLASLAIVDAAFAGFRAAAGRDGRIFKRRYYARAVRRGALGGAILVAVLALVTSLALRLTPAGVALWLELIAIGARMLEIFAVYAALVGGALLVYVFARSEVRILATVTVLGPLTLVRPIVVLAAVAFGLLAPGPRSTLAFALTACSSAAVLALGALLDRIELRVARERASRSSSELRLD